ncbi:MAG: cysteine methyltransferase [SAR86 cluster bacterium]|uniref:Methylated-DNA--protein-cysteine methyltransferase n=1 Tax=SAR86 cluster bacterium TaxID=2030880 RepID=A0A2A5AV38_9GAMM|nr:MAG: cysteine methyltransferase [SAR86 cluster bacterium]
MTIYYEYHTTPIGKLLLAGDGDSLNLLGFPGGKMQRRHEPEWVSDSSSFKEVRQQLDSYFAGELEEFELSLKPTGTTFQESVWQALLEIPYGETWSYGQLAKHIGKPKASRAVGAANGLNPIPVIIPCHRVIGASGKLTGFGGGLETKQYLLGLESESATPGFDFS